MNLIDLLCESYIEDNEARGKKEPSGNYHPSAVSDCKRKQVYRRLGVGASDPISPMALMKMDHGTLMHENYQNRLRQKLKEKGCTDIQVEKEIWYNFGDHKIHGYMDLAWKEGNKWIGAEIKTGYGRGISMMKDKPKQDHLEQTMIYIGASDVKFSEFHLYYFARDNGYPKSFTLDIRNIDGLDTWCCGGVPLDFDFADLVNRFYHIAEYVKKKEIPDRPYLAAIKNGQIVPQFQKDKKMYKTKWNCNYCSYQDYCWKDVVEKYKDGDNSEMFNED